MSNERKNQPGEPEGAHHKASGGEPGGAKQRFSAKRKVPAARIAGWRDAVLQGGAEAMKRRDEHNPALARFNAKIGEHAMENELLREKIAHLESGRPLPRRRSRS